MNEAVRSIIEIGLGLIYTIGAVFNLVYTRNHGDEFYGSFAEGTLIAPMRMFINGVVIPNSGLFTTLLVGFQLVVAFSIFSRGPLVGYGLYAGAFFCLGAALASNVPGAIANLLLGVGQFFLATTR